MAVNKSDEKPLEKAVPHDDDLFQYFNWLWTTSWKECEAHCTIISDIINSRTLFHLQYK